MREKKHFPRVAYEAHKLKKTDKADKQRPLAELQQCHKEAGSDLDAYPPQHPSGKIRGEQQDSEMYPNSGWSH